ncbi:MAG: nucleotidyl transferase AbiEii/AbiGii toxin family protein [Thermoplasmata archaeon]
MPEQPDKAYLDNISRETDFLRDPLEKVYRLIDLLGAIVSAPTIQGNLTLKGGTALQFIYLDFRRLSVDIDFNYIGSVKRDKMIEDRKKIHKMLSRIFQEFNYKLENNFSFHALEQYILTYENCVGNNDRMKVEINYLERLPVIPIIQKSMKHPFDFLEVGSIPTFQYEELAAQKTRALISRATPRDLYDIYLISKHSKPFDIDLYRKLTLFYLCLNPDDIRKISLELIDNIDNKDIKRHLAPMLRRREYSVDLEEMKKACLKMVEPVLCLTDEERDFLEEFYERNSFEQKILFGDIELDADLMEHPGLKWRLKTRD